jgi:ribosomal protein S12 methylthiotransferase
MFVLARSKTLIQLAEELTISPPGEQSVAKIGFISLGCPKNLVDSEVMIGLLQAKGHVLTVDPKDADILIVNTCSFIDEAKKESIETILAGAQLKSSGNCRKLIVTGCLSERYPNEIRSDLTEVDAVLGTNQIEEIVRAVEGGPVDLPSSYGRRDADLYLYNHDTPRTLIGPRYAAYMKVSEGCDHRCAFCVIPKIRGPFRSRTIPSLVQESTQLAAQGVKEITLISQDTTSYGRDLGIPDGLAQLLEALDAVPGIRWIRFLYVSPNLVSDRLIEVLNSSDKICRYIDMPLQHASAGVLRSMRRGGNRAGLTRMIERIRNKIPGVTIRTTMIVGFPGESREDFQELKNFCREMEFDRLGVFAYSDEEDTPAYALQPKVAHRTATQRRRILMEQQSVIANRKNRSLIGKEFTVLVEGPSEESELLLQGRLESQAPEIDGVCLINDSDVGEVRGGEFHAIRITQALEHDLLGKIVR